jgi:single-strand DNA-binding protein
VVWGAQGVSCKTYLVKGRPVAIEGRLEWREWEAKDDGGKRQAVQIVANTVQFLGSKDSGSDKPKEVEDRFASDGDRELEGAGVGAGGGAEDDIPF